MLLKPRDNGNLNFNRGNRDQIGNSEVQGREIFGHANRVEYSNHRSNFTNNNNHGTGRGYSGLNRNFKPTYHDNPRPAKWDTTFQAQVIDGRAMVEALKKLSTYARLRQVQQTCHIQGRYCNKIHTLRKGLKR